MGNNRISDESTSSSAVREIRERHDYHQAILEGAPEYEHGPTRIIHADRATLLAYIDTLEKPQTTEESDMGICSHGTPTKEYCERCSPTAAAGTQYGNVSCSQCGASFGPGQHGFSHCDQHQRPEVWIPELIRNNYDKAPNLGKGGYPAQDDEWDDGADDIARKIIERFGALRTPSTQLDREKAIKVIAVAWAEKSSLRPTLEQTFEYQRVQAGRFIASGEAAAIADAIIAAIGEGSLNV